MKKAKLVLCPHDPNPRVKCSIPIVYKRNEKKQLEECQNCPTWEKVYEQHQEDVL